MNYERILADKINVALAGLSSAEKMELQKAANGKFDGGDALKGPLRARAIELELAYKSTGKLRPAVYKKFQPDTPIIMRRG